MLERYKILHELGRGATGAVYAARDRQTDGTVALKRLDPALLETDRSFAERFLKQAHSARLLKHRNIVRIHDAGQAAGTAYVAMEMLEGESLRKILDAGPLPTARAIRIAHDIACGLAHAHLEGVVHGGLRPSNIIVLRAGAVKIADFGIGQLGQPAAASGARAGGVRYLSPEQVRGEPLDHRCDIFSLGALFYEMLTHRPAFEGGSPSEIIENILHAEPPRPSELNPLVPPALDAVVSSMLAKQPAVRMPGAPILLRELERLQEALGLGAGANVVTHEPIASEPPLRPEPRRPAPEPWAAEDFQRRDPIPDGDGVEHLKALLTNEREYGPPPGSRTAIFAGLAAALLLGAGLAGLIYFSSGGSEFKIAASRTQAAPPPAVASAPPASPPPPVAEPTKQAAVAPTAEPTPPAPKPVAAQETPSAQTESPVSRVPQPPPAAAPAKKLPLTVQPRAPVAAKPAGTARVIVAVSPRGEIYIDGEHHGTTPPITTFDLEPGMHRIEVRSGSRKPYLTYIAVQAGDVRRIRHDFNAKPIRPRSG